MFANWAYALRRFVALRGGEPDTEGLKQAAVLQGGVNLRPVFWSDFGLCEIASEVVSDVALEESFDVNMSAAAAAIPESGKLFMREVGVVNDDMEVYMPVAGFTSDFNYESTTADESRP
jgi:hypothetical protein